MKEQKVIAKKGKEVVGEKTIQLAENVTEATKIAGSEARLVEMFNRQYVTDTRNSLARPSTGSVELKTRVELFENMVKAGVPEAKALEIAKISKDDVAKVKSAPVKAA